ncbi:hypothetical protein P4O66_021965 [Electrophorus voltai]|uniref:Uncharacterized protein n=1 Tax=Electrophorus voltai TaxID=2609070 RepID=A0AAD8ZQA1_9TELE|nr:hypothetical protein P4O66_021965 [Electrophorus voltai]
MWEYNKERRSRCPWDRRAPSPSIDTPVQILRSAPLSSAPLQGFEAPSQDDFSGFRVLAGPRSSAVCPRSLLFCGVSKVLALLRCVQGPCSSGMCPRSSLFWDVSKVFGLLGCFLGLRSTGVCPRSSLYWGVSEVLALLGSSLYWGVSKVLALPGCVQGPHSSECFLKAVEMTKEVRLRLPARAVCSRTIAPVSRQESRPASSLAGMSS